MPIYRVVVEGTPAAWQRPRSTSDGYFTRSDRPHDMAWRTTVRAAWLAQAGNLALTGPVSLSVEFYGGRGDLDNLCKGVSDSLGVRGWKDGFAPAYLDDRQVRRIRAEHHPATKTCRGAVITIETMEDK